ncbi:hypothetical protein [Xanthomonas phage Xp15]|uniref:Uncharacterized protein n=1 Tax=Xanthomonas phage Xp15 TaxID=322855 RepID=Q52PN6_9CAUD|nr:hypothetical protein XPXV15_gp40 [Xanthomonas phage Xp15]AAX84929.1 hypothetical protein [Xanthomonas phage Xp15]
MASQQISIPEHLKKFLTNSGTSSDADAMAAASVSIPRISLRGRKFRLVEGGEEIRKPADELLCVILAVEPGAGLMQKTFYAKGYVSGESAPPDCASSNGVTPDAWISDPVSAKCNGCPKNVFGSATSTNGKKTKACKDSKRLWVVEPDNINGTVFALGIPVTSLKAMSEYGAMLKSNGVPAASVITRLSMKDSEFPELEFAFAGVLSEEPMEQAMLRNEQKNWDLKSSAPMLEHDTGPKQPMKAPGADALLEHKAAAAEPGVTTSTVSVDEATGNW